MQKKQTKKTPASQQKRQIKPNKSKAYYVLLLLQSALIIHDIRILCSTQKQSNITIQTTSQAYMSSSSQYCAVKGHIMRRHLPREKEQLFVIMCSACIFNIMSRINNGKWPRAIFSRVHLTYLPLVPTSLVSLLTYAHCQQNSLPYI